jgi:hypothetical protein
MNITKTLLVVLTSLQLGACGLTAPRSDEGFADLDSLGIFDTDRKMALSIGPTILNFAARHVEDDPQTRGLLANLEGVRVRIYEINGDGSRVARRLNDISLELQVEGWEPVALVRDEDEQVHMLIKSRADRILGLVVMVSDSTQEVVLVNLMGNLPPRMFSDVMVALDLDAPTITLAAVD